MSEPEKSSSHRREFLAHVATAAAVLAGTACAAPLAAAGLNGSSAGGTHKAPFNDDWTHRVAAAKHKAVFDSPGVDDGLALTHATFFMQGYREQTWPLPYLSAKSQLERNLERAAQLAGPV